ncbi:MAG: ATP-dependent sacrificial sulfur transferase LarE [Pseudomonadota bacterium]
MQEKFNLLLNNLRKYKAIAIAFSGGVDSTLLLYTALAALGPENVVALYARSKLNAAASLEESRKVFEGNFPYAASMQEIEVFPLSWPEFVVNDQDRCYYCKKIMYMALQEAMAVADYSVLADGTNSDDRQEKRPGLRAIHELQIKTPLADVGLTKKEVRQLAKKFGLSNYNLPSNSCLATRIPENTPVSEETLLVIASAEEYLKKNGFLGCRVRVHDSYTIVEVQEKDIEAFSNKSNRENVLSFFLALQLAPVVLNLAGR